MCLLKRIRLSFLENANLPIITTPAIANLNANRMAYKSRLYQTPKRRLDDGRYVVKVIEKTGRI